jgi:hypothetical protein
VELTEEDLTALSAAYVRYTTTGTQTPRRPVSVTRTTTYLDLAGYRPMCPRVKAWFVLEPCTNVAIARRSRLLPPLPVGSPEEDFEGSMPADLMERLRAVMRERRPEGGFFVRPSYRSPKDITGGEAPEEAAGLDRMAGRVIASAAVAEAPPVYAQPGCYDMRTTMDQRPFVERNREDALISPAAAHVTTGASTSSFSPTRYRDCLKLS